MSPRRLLCSFCILALTASLFPAPAFGTPDAYDEEVPETTMQIDSNAIDGFVTTSPDAIPNDDDSDAILEAPHEQDELTHAQENQTVEIETGIEEQSDEEEAPLGNGPANSWRFDNGQLLEPDFMATDGDPNASVAAVRDGMYTTFETFYRGNCSGEGAARGIDVSKWQGYIDWARVKAAGIDFALIRCGYGDDLPQQDDEYFAANVRGCLQNNIPFGIYLYSYATHAGHGNEGALSEADHVIRCLRNAGLSPSQVSLPVYLDMEDRSTIGSDLYTVANAFCNAIESAGYAAGVYANTSWWSTYLTNSGFGRWSRWIAQYNTGRGVEYPFRNASDIWQFSSRGSIAGISGNVDLNYSYISQAYGGPRANMSEYKLVFDYAAYKKYNPSLSFGSESQAFQHFLTSGIPAGLRASEVFDPAYYKNTYSDLRRTFGNTWASYYDHFRNSGAREGRQGSREFSPISYYYAYPDLRAAYGVNPLSYYEHYINAGMKEGRLGTGCTDVRGSVTSYKGKDYSPVYDYSYYSSNNADVKRAFTKKFGNATVVDDAAILAHFVTNGMKEGRQGSLKFDYLSYYYRYPDLRAAFGTDVVAYYNHYLNTGRKEGRVATGTVRLVGSITKKGSRDYSPVYDYTYYVNHNADVARAFTKKFGKYQVIDQAAVLDHFIYKGMKEGRRGSSNFDYLSYYYRYADLRAAFGTDVVAYYDHYLNTGKKEGRIATGATSLMGNNAKYDGKDYSAVYNSTWYANHNGDLKRAFTRKFGRISVVDEKALINHFVNQGMKEGRNSSPDFSLIAYKERYSDLRNAFGNDNAAYYRHFMNAGKQERRIAI